MGPITCNDPKRGRWGGPPRDVQAQPGFEQIGTKAAIGLAAVPRGTVQLASLVARDVPELGVHASDLTKAVGSGQDQAHANGTATAGSATAPVAPPTQPVEPKKKTGCGCQSTDTGGVLWLGALAFAGIVRRRRRR
jgi:MYXO-CTERM domain-containing protein